MTTLPGMVTIELEGQLPDERFRAIWGLCIDIKVRLVFKVGEKFSTTALFQLQPLDDRLQLILWSSSCCRKAGARDSLP